MRAWPWPRWPTWRSCSHGIPLDRVTTSMTINAPAAVVLAPVRLRGRAAGYPAPSGSAARIQADILKEYIAQKEWIFPAEPSMRLMIDMIEWCTRADAPLAPGLDLGLPHPRGGGDGRPGAGVHPGRRLRLRRGLPQRGMDIDELRPPAARSSSTPTSTSSRRSASTGRPAGSGPASCGSASGRRTTAARADALPHADRRGVAHRAAAAGQPRPHGDRGDGRGARRHAVLHTNTYDEALALPTEEAARLALRTQQVILHETGAVHSADPLGGSWLVESMTDELERAGLRLLRPHRSAGRRGRRRSSGTSSSGRSPRPPTATSGSSRPGRARDRGRERAHRWRRADRDPEDPGRGRAAAGGAAARGAHRPRQAEVDRAVAGLQRAAAGDENVMPHLVECARAYASEGEICDALRSVWGIYRETPVF